MFGGYLPVERTTDYFFFKTPRQLGAQREENAHTKGSNKKKKVYTDTFKNRDKGARCASKAFLPPVSGRKRKCVELLDILE